MTDPDDDFTPPAPRSRFRRLRKVALWPLGVCAVLVLVAVVGRWQVGRVGQQRLDETTRKLDADDPGWRLDEVLDARKQKEPPAGENAAPVVLALAERVPKEFHVWQTSEDASRWHPRDAGNRLPPPDAVAAAREVAGPTLLVRADALKLRDARTGAYTLTVPADPLMTLLPHLQKVREVAALLQYDGYLAAVERNPNRGVSAARAALGAGRSIGDEPLFISQLVRMACAKVAAQTAMQVLAWGEPTEGLAELQAELLAEADVPWFRIGMRGERATLDRVFGGLEDGTITPQQCLRYAEVSDPGPEYFAAFRTYKALLPGDRAKCLQLCTEYVEASKLPPHEQLDAVRRVPLPKRDANHYRFLVTCLLLPACEKLAEAGLRTRADLLAAATCVACERFRREEGRWPRDLAELTPTYLPAVPVSPFDGKPIRYRVFDDRVAVYFLWANAPSTHVKPIDDFRDGDTPGTIGYRLWNPDRRGLPAEEKNQP